MVTKARAEGFSYLNRPSDMRIAAGDDARRTVGKMKAPPACGGGASLPGNPDPRDFYVSNRHVIDCCRYHE
ncbi:MAG: hypothetical protein WAL71_16370 [Terriglobales bacterium]